MAFSFHGLRATKPSKTQTVPVQYVQGGEGFEKVTDGHIFCSQQALSAHKALTVPPDIQTSVQQVHASSLSACRGGNTNTYKHTHTHTHTHTVTIRQRNVLQTHGQRPTTSHTSEDTVHANKLTFLTHAALVTTQANAAYTRKDSGTAYIGAVEEQNANAHPQTVGVCILPIKNERQTTQSHTH